jgi:tRNA modification GTPase
VSDDTIFALSSGALPAAIAIVRISGPLAAEAATKLAGSLPKARHASLRRLVAADGSVIDEAVVLYFPAPNTATGETVVEFHLHGGRAVVARFLQELSALRGLREAEPGEFTRRSLLNSRLDLTQAEGLADLLSAETEWQRRAAMESAGGALSRQIEDWRGRLINLSAQVEAAIDYVGDEDETAIDMSDLAAKCERLLCEWREWLALPPAEVLTDGLQVVLAGPPNSGKSSLLNALVGSERAIVTPLAGTTRDLIEVRLDLDGMPLTLVDTAGLRSSDDEIERIGIARAEAAVAAADLVLWLGDPAAAPPRTKQILIHSRADEREPRPAGSIPTSVKAPGGLLALRSELIVRGRESLPPPDRATLNRRQRAVLQTALNAIAGPNSDDIVVLAEQLRQAIRAFDRLTGRQGTEDVLDALFGRFCLGK